MKMYMKLALATTALSLVAMPVMAAHTNAHVRTLANQEITKRKPELRGNTGPQGIQGIQGIPGAPGARGLNGATGGFKLFDSLGVEVGHVMYSVPRFAVTLIPYNGVNVSVLVTPSGYETTVRIGEPQHFTTTDCTGPFYFNENDLTMVFSLVTPSYVDGSTVYVLNRPALFNVPEGVQYSVFGEGSCYIRTAGPDGINLIPPMPLVDLNTLFTRPFNLGL